MPYAPSVNDVSGQILAQGISSGVGGILQGMAQKAEERRQKEREKQLQNTLGPVIEQLSGGRIKLEDAPKEAWPMLFQAAQQEMQRPYEELRLRNAELENVIRSLDVARAPGRAALEDETTALNNEYTRARIEAARTRVEPFTPQLIDLGNGRAAMTTSPQSAVPIADPRGRPANSPLGNLLADIRAAEAAGDTEGAAVLRQGLETQAAGRRKEMDEVTLLRWQGLEQQKVSLMQAIQAEDDAISGGENYRGFLNMSSRAAHKKALEAQLAKVQAAQRILLARPDGSTRDAPTTGGAAAGSTRQTGGGGATNIDPDDFYQGY